MRQKVGQLRGLSVVDTSQATKEEPMLPQAANLYRIVPTGLIAVLCSCASMPTAQMQETESESGLSNARDVQSARPRSTTYRAVLLPSIIAETLMAFGLSTVQILPFLIAALPRF